MKAFTLAACIAASLAFAAGPAAAHYQHYQDPGAAIAGGLLGLGIGAAIGAAQQQQTPPICTAPDGEQFYATAIDGRWECETD